MCFFLSLLFLVGRQLADGTRDDGQVAEVKAVTESRQRKCYPEDIGKDIRGESNANWCPSGASRIETAAACKSASGDMYQGEASGTEFPKGCFQNGHGYRFFNTHPVGGHRTNNGPMPAPVCHCDTEEERAERILAAAEAERVNAKNQLERYLLNTEELLIDGGNMFCCQASSVTSYVLLPTNLCYVKCRVTKEIDDGEDTIEKAAVQDARDWLAKHQLVEKEEFYTKQTDLEDVVNPILEAKWCKPCQAEASRKAEEKRKAHNRTEAASAEKSQSRRVQSSAVAIAAAVILACLV